MNSKLTNWESENGAINIDGNLKNTSSLDLEKSHPPVKTEALSHAVELSNTSLNFSETNSPVKARRIGYGIY